MQRYFYLLPILIFSIAALGFSSSNLNRENQSLIVSPTVTPTPNQSEEQSEIVLDKKVVCLPLEPGFRPLPNTECDSYDMTVTVSAAKPENNQIKYEYRVSGGRVIGEGAKIIWDLTGVQPGTYEIRVDINDKSNGQKRAENKTITVYDSTPICVLCVCPTLEINTPTSPTKVGETMTFTANVSGGSQSEITYNWKVSAGEIIEGQETPVIRVATNSKMAGKIVKATVEIKGVCEECPTTESAEASVAKAEVAKKPK